MSQQLEIWLFAVTNLLTLVLGSVLTVLAYRAYLREDLHAFRIVTAGFALITLGTFVELVYELSVNEVLGGGFTAFGAELFLLRTVEGILIALGFGLFIYSLNNV
ncbi:DUF7521 family protein [Halalkalicoccus salilacus]|uniref:DUF7521 family protein n=1 Tax=Halalkalicoccus salilacus TaxID=3117459 RepID=UPI00300EDD2D